MSVSSDEEEFTFGDSAPVPSPSKSMDDAIPSPSKSMDDAIPKRKKTGRDRPVVKYEDPGDDDLEEKERSHTKKKKKKKKKKEKKRKASDHLPADVVSSSTVKSNKKKKVKRENGGTSTKKSGSNKELKKLDKAERLQYAMQSFLWWNAAEPPTGCQWTTMEHAGVSFPETYQPHGVKMKYDGVPVDLTPLQEEAASF